MEKVIALVNLSRGQITKVTIIRVIFTVVHSQMMAFVPKRGNSNETKLNYNGVVT